MRVANRRNGHGSGASGRLRRIIVEQCVVGDRRYSSPTCIARSNSGVSVGWEYLFEAWVERPSGQDLLVTSPIGSLQGELRFQMRRSVAQWNRSVGRDALLILIDPVEALHRYVGKEFPNLWNDATDETVGSSLNVGPDQARVMITLQF